MLSAASRSTSDPGDDRINDDAEGDSDGEAEVLDAVYFRLLTTVDIPSVWSTSPSARRLVGPRFLNGSGMSL